MCHFHNYIEFYDELERRISSTVANIYENDPTAWDENHITLSVLQSIRGIGNHIQIDRFNHHNVPINVSWDFFKLSVPLETDYGDIAIIVNLLQPNGTSIRGLGALEAKRINQNRSSFESLAGRLNQIENQVANLPRSCVLLYDHQPIAGYIQNISSLEYFHHPIFSQTYATTVPSNLLLASGRTDTLLYPLSVPLSYQLAWRFLKGFDLHYDLNILSAIDNFSTEKRGGFKFLVVATIIKGDSKIDTKHSSNRDSNKFKNYEPL